MEAVDVLVIGGGPAGSTAATMLRRKGWSVRLFDMARFPREHIGESLLPASIPVLEDLGVIDEVKAQGFTVKWGATMVWGRETEPWSWYFRETNITYPHAYQVWRPTFDHILLRNAAKNGVEVFEQHRVMEVLFEEEKAVGLRVKGPDGQEWEERARFIVDASGQSGIIGRARKLRNADASFQNLAVYAYFDGAERLAEPDQGNILIESYEHGWFWNIPLHNGWMSVGAVVDHTIGQEGIRRVGPEGFLREQIAETSKTKEMLRNAKLSDGPVILRDWSYTSEQVAGDGWVLAGDAACFIDPLFSSGVHLALSAGTLASAYVTSALNDPGIREASATVYQQLYYQQYSHFREMAKLFYSTNMSTDSYFWEARRLLNAEDSGTPRESFLRAVAGQPPRGYERVVLEKGMVPQDFAEALMQIESERAKRAAWSKVHFANPAELAHSRPCIVADAKVEKRPVLGDGEFEWGYVVATTARPDGVPLSIAAAKLVSLIDGERTVARVIEELVTGLSVEDGRRLGQAAFNVMQILYVDGVIASFAGVE